MHSLSRSHKLIELRWLGAKASRLALAAARSTRARQLKLRYQMASAYASAALHPSLPRPLSGESCGQPR